MTETFLALVPDYGVIVVCATVFLACLAVPVPASILVLTAGSFAASGDLSGKHVLIGVFCAYILGDQFAYGLAAKVGKKVKLRLEKSPRYSMLLARSSTLLERRGMIAVALSHTIISPLCPYVTYLCGMGGLNWHRFTMASVTGAAVWSLGYVWLGMMFATRLEQIKDLLSNFFGVILTITVFIACATLLRHRWQQSHAKEPN